MAKSGLSHRKERRILRPYVVCLRRPEKAAAGPDLSIYLREAEKTLATRFGRKVHIINGRKKGKIELEYYNPEDLNTLLELLEQLPSAGKGGVSL